MYSYSNLINFDFLGPLLIWQAVINFLFNKWAIFGSSASWEMGIRVSVHVLTCLNMQRPQDAGTRIADSNPLIPQFANRGLKIAYLITFIGF